MARPIVIGMATGVVAALACVALLRLLGSEPTAAVVGGVTGAVVGAAAAARRKTSGQAVQPADAADWPSAGR
jgi:hypothetical protein